MSFVAVSSVPAVVTMFVFRCVTALGCLLYTLCQLKHPFEADSFPALAVKISTGTGWGTKKVESETSLVCPGKYERIQKMYSENLRSLVSSCRLLSSLLSLSLLLLHVGALHAVPESWTKTKRHADSCSALHKGLYTTSLKQWSRLRTCWLIPAGRCWPRF